MAKKAAPRKVVARPHLLGDEDRKALTDEARKSILSEMQQEERDRWFEAERLRLRRESIPEEALVYVTIDIPPFLPFIMLDGVQFFHGYTYEVSQPQQSVILEQTQRAWHHQDEIDGRGRAEAYRRPSNERLGPQHAGQPTRGQNGTVVAEL